MSVQGATVAMNMMKKPAKPGNASISDNALNLNSYQDFSCLPFEQRMEALFSNLVQSGMLSKLPQEISTVFIDGFLYPTKDKLKLLHDFFARPEVSVITTHIINHKPGSHKALEPIYNKAPAHLVDQYFYECPAGDAIPDRLQAVVKNVPDWVRFLNNGKKEINVIVPGSGPAQDIIKILSQNKDLKERIKAFCIDNEPEAVIQGKQMAHAAGVLDRINYVEGDFMKQDFNDMDLALLVGIICPLPNSISIRLLRKVSSYLRPGGLIVVSSAMQKMLLEDPVTCYVMDFVNWKLCYRSEQDLAHIFTRANLEEIGHFYDPKNQFHRISVVRK